MGRLRQAHSKVPAQKAEAVQTEISALQTLPHADLKQRWHQVFSFKAPHNLSKRLLVHALTYELQVSDYGGLKKATKRILADAIAATRQRDTLQSCPTMSQSDGSSTDAGDTSPIIFHPHNLSVSEKSNAVKHQRLLSSRTPPQPITLSPGTRLMREWRGVVHVVDRTENGFMWNGKVHRSLSAIARAITGVRWNGLAFFGLRRRKENGRNTPDVIKDDGLIVIPPQPYDHERQDNSNNLARDKDHLPTAAIITHQPSNLGDPAP
ncbi:MAG: DUF2924 domain-containing protein [Sphingomonadales bacterium]|nr:DUF2924 domain-containing protein [Sphingomonadales bacterium]